MENSKALADTMTRHYDGKHRTLTKVARYVRKQRSCDEGIAFCRETAGSCDGGTTAMHNDGGTESCDGRGALWREIWSQCLIRTWNVMAASPLQTTCVMAVVRPPTIYWAYYPCMVKKSVPYLKTNLKIIYFFLFVP